MEKGCKICEKYKEHYYEDHLNGKNVEFYELMHGDFSQHLRMPKKFASYFKGKLPAIVDLKGPSGKIWPVQLKKTSDGVLLKSGWKEFVEYHHIQESYLLVFKYDGKFSFDVTIFDENHCKKAACYLFMDKGSEKQPSEDSLEVLNVDSRRKVAMRNPSGCPRHEMQHASPFSTARKMSRENEQAASKYQRVESSYKRRTYRSNEHPVHPKNKHCNTCPDIGARGTRHRMKPEFDDIQSLELEKLNYPNLFMSRRKVTYKQQELAIELLHSVQPDNPCFLSFLQPGSVSKGYHMYIPHEFQKAHLPSKRCNLVLQVPDQGKKWRVELFVYNNMSRFCWESFVVENDLKVGDACLFELVDDSIYILMTVHIIHATGRDN